MGVVTGGGGGGGGFKPSRNVGQVELDFAGLVVADGANALAPFVFSDGDAAMLDLTVPTAPLPVVAGIYAYTFRVSHGGAQGLATLVIDDDYYSISASAFLPGGDPAALSATWFCTARSPFFVRCATDPGGGGDTFAGSLYVQKIAG